MLCSKSNRAKLESHAPIQSRGGLVGSEAGLKVERSGGVGSSTGESKKLHALNPHLSFA